MTQTPTKNPYSLFSTDADLEVQGIEIDYGDFWFKIRRAGGNNKRFGERCSELMKPLRRAIQTETADPKMLDRLTLEAFAETVLVSWGSKLHGDGFMVGPDNSKLEFTKDNIVQLLQDLPDLAEDLLQQSRRVALFRKTAAEADAGN